MLEDPFFGSGLLPVEPADRTRISSYLSSLSEPLSDYTFSQILTWRNSLRLLWREIDGHLCVFANGSGDLTLLLPPIGPAGSDKALRGAFDLMDQYNATHGVPDRSRVEYVSDELLPRFNRAGLIVEPMSPDYVYETQRMIDLAGGDLKSKRQDRNRFMRDHAYQVERYDRIRHREECLRLLDEWKIQQDANHLDESNTNSIKRQKESIAAALALDHADDLGLRGMIVRVGDDHSDAFPIRAFTFGEHLGRDQSSVVIEKTDLAIKGLAQFIFSEFCRSEWADRPFVNAGDDWGLETLAWTKRSYRPVKLLNKYVLRKIAATMVPVTYVHPTETAYPASAVPANPIARPVPAAHQPTVMPPTTVHPSTTAHPTPAAPTTAIRLARRGDVEKTVELESSCFTTYRLSKRQLSYLQSHHDSVIFLVAEQADRIVGEGIALLRHTRRGLTGRIYSLAVREDCRGQQIGRKLLTGLIDGLRNRGVERVYLEVDLSSSAAIRLYESAGFQRLADLPDYYGQGRHGMQMLLQTGVISKPVRPAA